MNEEPVIIDQDNCKLFGILRNTKATKIVILIPALTGTRIGPQNIYVSLARHLALSGTASLCIELPPAGDSYDKGTRSFNAPGNEVLFPKYEFYMSLIYRYLVKEYSFTDYYFASISLGCMPVLKFCNQHKLAGALMLSPNHLEASSAVVNTSNLKSYFHKFFMAQTWKKLFSLKINFSKVFNNVFKKPAAAKKLGSGSIGLERGGGARPLKVLCVFGDKDVSLGNSLLFWENLKKSGKISKLSTGIIAGADHSFYGWKFKEDVCSNVENWINAN